MALVIRIKYVSRAFLLLASVAVWLVLAVTLNDVALHMEETILLGAALLAGAVQTWILVVALRT